MALAGIAAPTTLPGTPSTARRDLRLALVAAGYTALQLLLAAPGRSLAWDESIYFSQVDPRSPAAFFSAPRSRGVTLLGAPVALVTSDPLVIRSFLAILSGLGLYAAFAGWRRLIGGGASALAALLFATLWVSVEYGSQVMPNLWVGFGAVAAAGLFLRAAREEPKPRLLVGLAAAVGWVTLVRAPDGVWLALPLLAWAALVRPGRWMRIAAAVAGGVAAGMAQWVVEAYVRFGGISERLADSGRIEGGMSLTWNVGNALRSADGPLLCRPCQMGFPSATHAAWWLALPLLSGAAVVVARRTGRTATAVLPVSCALSLSAPYLFVIGYFAPRFLLPAYALLVLPIADLAATGLRAVRYRPSPGRVAAAALVAISLAGHWFVQQQILHRQITVARASVGQYRALADALRRAGVRPPCLVAGDSIPIAYDAGCASTVTAKPATDSSAASGADVLRSAAHESVAVLVPPGGGAPWYAPSWQRHPLTGSPLVAGWSAYLPPAGR